MEKYYDKISLWGKFVNKNFIFAKTKKIYSNEEEIKKYIEKLSKRNQKYNLPQKMGLKLENYSNMKVYSYNGSLTNLNKKILLYIHGGSYIEEAGFFQIKFAMEIAKKTNSILVFPVYPLAPTSNYKVMYELINDLYNILSNSNQQINLLGDSAGGGFVLSYSMYLREMNMNQPDNIVMLSPWLDVSLENSDLREFEKIDNMSGIEGNQYAGKLWANGLDLKNYLISPLYGSFNNLGKMTIIIGARDLLKPDCLILSEKLKKLDIPYNYIEYRGQGHDFGAYPTKEGNLVKNDIVNIINEEYGYE